LAVDGSEQDLAKRFDAQRTELSPLVLAVNSQLTTVDGEAERSLSGSLGARKTATVMTAMPQMN
jgi:hypothetical protein